jgi:predicted transcriptional regulator of viral defense system
MFIEYLEKLRSGGKRYFTSQKIMQDLNLSSDATRAGLYRLKRDGKLISPIGGLYVIIPPEHKSYGCLPAEELIPIMMKHLDAEYYVALLSAAGFYGASHQKPMVFQVVTNRRIKHSLKFGLVHIKLIYKKSLYCANDNTHIRGEDFLKNLALKKNHPDFQSDMSSLLSIELRWNFEEAYQFVVDNVISRLP